MHPVPTSPLSEAELEKLDGWLGAAAGPIADVEALDGFLVALVIGPELVPPSRFVQILFGSGEDHVLVFPSAAEAHLWIPWSSTTSRLLPATNGRWAS